MNRDLLDRITEALATTTLDGTATIRADDLMEILRAVRADVSSDVVRITREQLQVLERRSAALRLVAAERDQLRAGLDQIRGLEPDTNREEGRRAGAALAARYSDHPDVLAGLLAEHEALAEAARIGAGLHRGYADAIAEALPKVPR